MSKNRAAHSGAKATFWHHLRKVGVLRLSLGGIALAGATAAATSAGWTGSILFNAPASASSFVLQGNTTAADCTATTGWKNTTDASTTGATTDGHGNLTLTLTDFSQLSPSTPVTKDVWVRNAPTSSQNASVALTAATVTGDVFGTTSPHTGSAALTLTPAAGGGSATITGTGGTSNGPVVTVTATGANQPLAPFSSVAASGCVKVEIVVTPPSNWDYAYQGTSGTLSLTLSGQSTSTARS